MFCTLIIQGQNEFITIWDSNQKGLGTDHQILLPLRGKYKVDWFEIDNPNNKGTKENCYNNEFINFPKPGIYQINASGEITSMNNAFFTISSIPTYGEKNYKLLSVESWGNIEWKSFNSFFYRCCNFKINTKEAPNLSKVKSCFQLFCGAENFNDSIGHWDMSNVEDMSYLFYDAYKFNQPINEWNVSKVITMHSMFGYAKEFNQPINNWNVNSVQKMSGMFNHAYKFNQAIGNWNLKNVKTMAMMFDGAYSFNQPLANWDVSNIEKMTGLFWGASSFNQPINNWNVSNVSEFTGMFWKAKSFNQDINNWDVSKVSSITRMFFGAFSFNQSLESWTLKEDCKITFKLSSGETTSPFKDSAMTKENIIKTLKGWGKEDLIDLYLEK